MIEALKRWWRFRKDGEGMCSLGHHTWVRIRGNPRNKRCFRCGTFKYGPYKWGRH